MNILVLGAGEVGFHIALRLASEGHDVAVIDNNKDRIQRVADTMDVRTVLGNAAHPSVLESAGAENADLLIAATASDETNMLACQVAHSLFKVTTKMARVREPDFTKNQAQLIGRDDRVDLGQAYLQFMDYVLSSGASSPDWYRAPETTKVKGYNNNHWKW